MLAGARKLLAQAIAGGGARTSAEIPLEDRLERAGAAWRHEMAPLTNELGVVLLPDYAILPARCVRNCRVFPLREDILEQMPKGGVIAEVGVQAGEFSQAILDICRPRTLELIDIDMTRFRVPERFAAEVAAGTVRVHEGDSAATMASFPDGHFDVVYIDADHSYEGVKRDIAAAHAKVKPGGHLLFNDYTFWSSGECIPYGVMQGVNALCIEHGWEIAFYAFGYYGYADVALRRIADVPEG
jgi:precorrin-6B methylase 2